MTRTTTRRAGRLGLLAAAGAGLAFAGISLTTAATASAATATAAPATAAPVFSYVGESYTAPSRGAYATIPVARPRLAANADHSLVELAVQSADRSAIIETGWVRSRGIAGGPRLFVSYWAGGHDYVDSGFVSTSATIKPFQELRPGTSDRFGIVYGHGRWTISLNGTRFGYFSASHWGGAFRTATTVQAFGEVESYGHSNTQMVDGTTRRSVTGFRLAGARTPAGAFYSTASRGYYLGHHGATWFQLGGTGR